MTESENAPLRKPRSRAFRAVSKIPPANAKREGEITKLAFLLLGSSEAAISLLNQSHPDLGARPLDLATASDEGFAAVERIIRRLAESAKADL